MQEPFDEENEEEHIEDQQTENELKKIKLALEHGMDLSKSLSDPELPPEVEGQFLDYIQQWEDEYAKGKMVKLYELAGKPAWKPAAIITDDNIAVELDRILELLRKHGITVDTICEVENRELYRFITEELFEVETNDIRIPGMMHCFTYEEFHPNHEHDIKNRCTELLHYVIDSEHRNDSAPSGLADKVWYGGQEFTKEELNKKLINFRDSFSSFTIHELVFTEIAINEAKNSAEVIAGISYEGVIEGSSDTLQFSGDCKFSMVLKHEWWTITKLEIPGVKV